MPLPLRASALSALVLGLVLGQVGDLGVDARLLVLGQLDAGEPALVVDRDCRTVIKRAPSTYLEKFYFDSITFDPMMLKHLIDRFGAEHVLMGTDYPYDMGEDDPRGLIAAVKGLPAAQRKQIEGLNAMKLLKIKL